MSRPAFFDHLAAMKFDRDFAEMELRGDLLVEQARGHQVHYLSLARAQRVDAGLDLAQALFFRSPDSVKSEGFIHCLKKCSGSPIFHQHSHAHFRMPVKQRIYESDRN